MARPALEKVSTKYGAPMGRRNHINDPDEVIKFYLYPLRWVDGDYDEGGAYWGYVRGEYIYRAVGWGEEYENEIFVRARTRTEAKEKVKEVFRYAMFFK